MEQELLQYAAVRAKALARHARQMAAGAVGGGRQTVENCGRGRRSARSGEPQTAGGVRRRMASAKARVREVRCGAMWPLRGRGFWFSREGCPVAFFLGACQRFGLMVRRSSPCAPRPFQAGALRGLRRYEKEGRP